MTQTYFSPEQLKRINGDPALVSLLYDLDLLPEQVIAGIRHAREEEREHCLRLVEAPIVGLLEHAKKVDQSGGDSGMWHHTITTLQEAAKAIRESGEFRDKMGGRTSSEKKLTKE